MEGNWEFPPKGNPPGKSSTWVSCEDDKSEGVADSMIYRLCDEERKKSLAYVNEFYEDEERRGGSDEEKGGSYKVAARSGGLEEDKYTSLDKFKVVYEMSAEEKLERTGMGKV